MTILSHPIVMVDDDPSLRRIFADMAKRWGPVQTYESAQAVLEEIHDLRPSIFVLDWLMPGMNGIELCQELRKMPRFDFTPIVFLTAVNPTLGNIKEAFAAGAQCFFSKGRATAMAIHQICVLAESYETLSLHRSMSSLMLSVLRHDMANALTAVVTGLEVLNYHPAMEDDSLREQVAPLQTWAGEIRELLLDTSMAVTAAEPSNRIPRQTTTPKTLLETAAAQLAELKIPVQIESTDETPIRCPDRLVGRTVYYLARYLHVLQASADPLVLHAELQDDTGSFGVDIAAEVTASCRADFSGAVSPDLLDNRNKALPVHFIRNVLRLLETPLTIVGKQESTTVQFSIAIERP